MSLGRRILQFGAAAGADISYLVVAGAGVVQEDLVEEQEVQEDIEIHLQKKPLEQIQQQKRHYNFQAVQLIQLPLVEQAQVLIVKAHLGVVGLLPQFQVLT